MSHLVSAVEVTVTPPSHCAGSAGRVQGREQGPVQHAESHVQTISSLTCDPHRRQMSAARGGRERLLPRDVT